MKHDAWINDSDAECACCGKKFAQGQEFVTLPTEGKYGPFAEYCDLTCLAAGGESKAQAFARRVMEAVKARRVKP